MTPTLAVTSGGPPVAIARLIASAVSAPRLGTAISTTANSSPPTRAIKARPPAAAVINRAHRTNTRSPTVWP
ncbi:Uncharacterised protein [Mycobacteroides abscessus subsp. abscessus]|nr:Uncharacterised protein [Mycobacteroides abscessus subsp. abscessus]